MYVYCQYKYVHLQMHESEWTEDFYVISKTGVQRSTLSDVFIFYGHDAWHVAQAESRTAQDHGRGQAGNQPLSAQGAADAAHLRELPVRP